MADLSDDPAWKQKQRQSLQEKSQVMLRYVRESIARTIRAMRLIATDQRVPRPLRWLAAIGLFPIPGPVDEAFLVLVAPIFLLFYRESMRDAWRRAAR
jgi:hypothetical protein